jgi:hypothetical protein
MCTDEERKDRLHTLAVVLSIEAEFAGRQSSCETGLGKALTLEQSLQSHKIQWRLQLDESRVG